MSDHDRTAAISGIGILSPIGNSCSEVLASLRGMRDGIVEATKIDTSKFASHLLGEVRGFDYSENMAPSEMAEYADPFIRLGICAARRAFNDAGIALSGCRGDIAMVLATCNAGMNSGEIMYREIFSGKREKFCRASSFQFEFYALQKILARALGFEGEAWTINTACSGSTAAIGFAQSLIESGRFGKVLVGGADAASLANFAGFSAIKVVSPEKTAPFSTPPGMNLGEGAAFWILEDEKSVRARGGKIYGKVIGSATSGDAHHPTQPDPRGDGAFRTMRDAAENAGLSASEIGCINAHGSGTQANDSSESKGIAKFLGDVRVPISSTKSYTGHCMGATGIIEATCQLLSMNSDFIPPTLRNSGRRPGCSIDAVSGNGIEKTYSSFLSANYAFAGNNAAIVVAKENFDSRGGKPKYAKSKRVVISGAGFVSSLGVAKFEQIEALFQGRIGISKISRFDSARSAGCVNLPNMRAFDRRVDFSGMNRISSYAAIASKQALDSAGLRVGRENCESVGLAAAVCRGASESAHMEAVFGRDDMRGDIACFSNVTANSTAGWVSKALGIKGDNITLTSGPNSGIQAVAYAARRISDGRALQIVAVGADEIYKREMEEYDKIGNLYGLPMEENFTLSFSSPWKTVMGEGAAALLVEGFETARERGANILAEILGEASAMDSCAMLSPNIDGNGVGRAVFEALDRAGVDKSEIDLIVWSPRGNAQDKSAIDLCESKFSGVPMVCTSLNTGYMETGSTLHGLACALTAISDGRGLWRQRTGVRIIDARPLPKNPQRILCLASSFAANSHALILARGDIS